MRVEPTRSDRHGVIEATLFILLAAWLSASSVLLLSNRSNPDYFTLAFAALPGLFPLLLGTGGFGALYYFLAFGRRGSGTNSPDASLQGAQAVAGRLLFLSWLVFAFLVLDRQTATLPAATLLILSGTSLILARDVYRSAISTRALPDIGLGLAGLALFALNLKAVPWEPFKAEVFVNLGIESEAILPLLIAYLGILFMLYFLFSQQLTFFRQPYAVPLVMLFAMTLQIVLSGRILYARYASLSTPTYDFNLFAQMYHSMAETLAPVTTLERNLPLSHFKVHISPIFYLLLPFYALFRTPAVLQVLQGVVVGLGILPMLLIAREFRLSVKTRVALCIIYLGSAAYITSGFYDLHENAFLPVLLLWLIYFLEKRKTFGIVVFTVLTLLVKEDAALYVWALAAYVMLEYRMVKTGLVMLLGSASYFLGALVYLKEYGDGAMTDRFDSLIGVPGWSLLAVPYAVFRNPGFVLAKISGEGKLTYLFQMLAPLSFMPLFSRRLSRWILLVPFLLMNLMVDYNYQYDMRFQYNYGSYTLLLYLALLFLRDLGAEPFKGRAEIRTALLVVAMASGLLISAYHLADYERYPEYLKSNRTQLATMKAVMDRIPDDASVLASPFLTGYLSGREILYDLEYNVHGSSYYRADYIVVDLRPAFRDYHETEITQFLLDGYTIETNFTDQIMVLRPRE